MAEKRMLARSVIQSMRFLSLSLSAQALYMHLNVSADNDGVAEAYTVMRMCGAQAGDLEALLNAQLVKWLVEGEFVVVITDWLTNNNKLPRNKYPHGRYYQLLSVQYPALARERDDDVTPGVLPLKQNKQNKNKQEKNNNNNTVTDVVPSEKEEEDGTESALSTLIAEFANQYGREYVDDKVALLRVAANVNNPGAWLRRACEHNYRATSAADVASIKANPDCPICHGTGRQTRMIGDTGQSLTYECDCVRRRREAR